MKWIAVRSVLALIFCVFAGVAVDAATITVCASGCTFNNTQLQNAINAATYGDTITLQAGITYTGSFILPNKGAGTSYIIITSNAVASNLPAAGARTTPSYASFLPKIQSSGGGAHAVALDKGAHHYKFQHVEFLAVPQGFSDILQIGDGTWQFESDEPHDIIVDQCYFHGDPLFGQKRAIATNAKNVTITNGHFSDIKSVGQDSNCISGYNGHGPVDIENNFLECGTENVLFGGADPAQRTFMRVTGTPTTTSANVSTYETGHTLAELRVGQILGFLTHGGTKIEYATIASITGTGASGSLTWSPALTVAPDVPGDIRGGVVLGSLGVGTGLTMRHNYITKNPAWQAGVLPAPTGNSSTGSTSSGSLAAGAYFYKVQAFSTNGYQGETVNSAMSTETTATLGSAGNISTAWTAVSGSTFYRVWRATSTGAQSQYADVTVSPFVDSGTVTWTAGTPSSATKWQIKNLFEIKAVQNAQIDSNIFDTSWRGNSNGFAWWLKSVNQDGTCWFCQSRDIVMEKNIIRHVDGMMEIVGQEGESGYLPPPMTNVTIRNNLVYDSSPTWGEGDTPYAMLVLNHTVNFTFDHNTVIHTMQGTISIDSDVKPFSVVPMLHQGLVITNNMLRAELYGIHTSGGTGACALDLETTGGYTFSKNAVANTDAAAQCGSPPKNVWPTGGFYGTNANWENQFVVYTADGTGGADYHIKVTSAYHNAGTDSKDIGADIDAVNSAVVGVSAGTGSTLSITTTGLADGVQTVAYNQTISATGGATPYSFAVTTGTLPTGLSLSSTTGVISGTPTGTGTSTFTVTVTEAGSTTASKAYTVVIIAPVSITQATPLPAGAVNSLYTQAIATTGGRAPYTWAVTAGTLPTGLSFNTTTGTLSGVPATTGTSTFTIQVTGASGSVDSKAFSLTIGAENLPAGRPTITVNNNLWPNIPLPSLKFTYSEAQIFRRGAAPTQAVDTVALGDIWMDTSSGVPVMKVATSTNPVVWTATSNNAGSVVGDGSGLTNLNASEVKNGTLPGTVFPSALSILSSLSTPLLSASTAVELAENTCTTLSVIGKARLCMDSVTHTVKLSQNGAAFTALGSGSGSASAIQQQPSGSLYILPDAINSLDFKLSIDDTGDSVSNAFGMATSNGRKLRIHSYQGTLRQSMLFGDASAGTEYIFVVGSSADSGNTWTRYLGVRQDGFVSVKALTLESVTAPTCDAAHRGQFNYVAGGTGVKDIVQICAKDAADAYAYRTIY